MSDRIAPILNSVLPTGDYTYLELGVDRNATFKAINSKDKESVDMRQECNPTYCMTTAEFFQQNEKRYDIVFIDANHDIDFVVHDYIWSRKIANKLIVMHDMYPPSEELTHTSRCSDSYKFLAYWHSKGYDYTTLNADYGLTFLLPSFPVLMRKDVPNTSYRDFINMNVRLLNESEIIENLKFALG